MKTENSNKDNKDPIETKKTNHFTVSIPKCKEKTYTDAQQLCTKLGCNLRDLVYYSLETILSDEELQPKSFGLQR
jgi:DNA-binding Xre family transcriptional regulator